METVVKGTLGSLSPSITEIVRHKGETVTVRGMVHSIRELGDVNFLILRLHDGVLQCVVQKERMPENIAEECAVAVTGELIAEERAQHGAEIHAETVQVLSHPKEPMPLVTNKRRMNTSLEALLNYRPVSLRNQGQRAIFKIQEGIVRGIREFFYENEFTEIHSPKIVAAGAEGGANIFQLDYFGKKAFLAQSPQFYKQTMVGVYERVFEIGPVFRAEKHSTSRHLNEYTSVDFEMGFLNSFYDIMDAETAMLRSAFQTLTDLYGEYVEQLKVEIPRVDAIPFVRFDEAKRLVAEKYGHPTRSRFDLEPEEEVLIGRYFKEEMGSDFVFVTHYPTRKRPFYAMDDPEDPSLTLSFDLLFRGVEITTGGQRIHDYDMQVDKMHRLGMDPEEFTSFLMIHKHGMPPHGGLGAGLERICARLLNLPNVRYCTMFPRDLSRLEP